MRKYIVTQTVDGKREMFTFPCEVHHDAMAEAISGIKNRTRGEWHRVRRVPVSAGFVDSSGNCYGESETLGLKSDKRDSELLFL